MGLAEWTTAAGEFLIALVIWWEMEVNRREGFLERAAEFTNYEDRGKIFLAFYDTSGESIQDKSREFCRRIWRDVNGETDLKRSCERQIVLFGRLGQIRRRAWVYKGDYVKLFPHAVILFWIMTAPYVNERRGMTGEWWASDFEFLTKKCLDFLLSKNPKAQLTLYGRAPEAEKLIVSTGDLRELQNELRRSKSMVVSQ
jgi:hypothetical protein